MSTETLVYLLDTAQSYVVKNHLTVFQKHFNVFLVNFL